MNELERLRREIDRLDAQIVRCFEQRMEAAKAVAAYKLQHGLPVLDKGREEEVLQKRMRMLEDKTLEGDIRRLFSLIMQLSRAVQYDVLSGYAQEREPTMRTNAAVAFQGDRGANSEAAVAKVFGADARRESYDTFEEVFAAVCEGRAGYGVVPVENSSTGGIAEIYDLLLRYPVYIAGEYALPIDHNLVGLPGAKLGDIREVYSHEQALKQCGGFLQRLANVKQIPYFNTAVSAKYIAESGDTRKAAIASAYAARLYGLEILARNISDFAGNTTRFLVLGAAEPDHVDADKASVCFVLEHKPGALARVLTDFAKNDLNMVKIESRPVEGRNFEYVFYVDFAGINIKQNLWRILENSGGLFKQFRVLGIYKGSGAGEASG